MSYEFTFIQNGHVLMCEIETDTVWRHNRATNQDYEEEFATVGAVWFQGVDVSGVIGEDVIDAILTEYEGAKDD